MSITLIVPPGSGGVRDFTDILAGHLTTGHTATVIALQKECANVISELALSSDCLYLQYSGYGYANRGAPLWLLQQLQNHRSQIKTLGVFFHELYAFGSPWESAFWLSPAQRHIARRLAELSDFWLTSREGSAQWLRRFADDKPHEVLPVFSNIGEMPSYCSDRAMKMVVFGGSALRLATYYSAGNGLFAWAKRQGLTIHDIGPLISDPVMSCRLAAEGVIVHGRLPETEVSRLLADAMFGLVVYPTEFVAKSGVFAAYCAHGICPVLISERYPKADGLVQNQHYLAGIHEMLNFLPTATSIGQAAWQWHHQHNVETHVQTVQKLSIRN